MSKSKKVINGVSDDFLKAWRKAGREIELENRTGFVSNNKVHKSKKTYTRKNKHNGRENN